MAPKDAKKDIAFIEAQIYRLIEILGEQREMTRDNVERKQARTEDERMDDEEDEEFVEEEEEEEEDDIIYNPKNLPLGWDGKPIPYWLYKLHGLNIDYKCQIVATRLTEGRKPSNGTLANGDTLTACAVSEFQTLPTSRTSPRSKTLSRFGPSSKNKKPLKSSTLTWTRNSKTPLGTLSTEKHMTICDAKESCNLLFPSLKALRNL